MEGLIGVGFLIGLIVLVILVVVVAIVGWFVLAHVGGPALIILGIYLIATGGILGGFFGGIIVIIGCVWCFLLWKG